MGECYLEITKNINYTEYLIRLDTTKRTMGEEVFARV